MAIAAGRPASFSGGAASAEEAALRRLGITGVSLVDGSGLSPLDRITPQALVRLVTLAASPAQGQLRAAITGLPVPGFSGTLAPAAASSPRPGRPLSAWSGPRRGTWTRWRRWPASPTRRNGELLAFAVMADQLKSGGLGRAGVQIARVATALAACGCSR